MQRNLLDRMQEGDFPCVQADATARVGPRRAVLEVAFDGAADAGELAADLVVPARQEFYFKEIVSLRGGDQAVAEPGEFGTGGAFAYDKGLVGFFVPQEPVLQQGGRLGGRGAAQCTVCLVDTALAEHRIQALQRLGSLGKQADAADRTVQPVRDAHKDLPGFAVPGGDERLELLCQGFVAGLVSLDNFARPLVEDQEMVVFVEDARFDVSRFVGTEGPVHHICQFYGANILTFWHKNQMAQDWIVGESPQCLRLQKLNN